MIFTTILIVYPPPPRLLQYRLMHTCSIMALDGDGLPRTSTDSSASWTTLLRPSEAQRAKEENYHPATKLSIFTFQI